MKAKISLQITLLAIVLLQMAFRANGQSIIAPTTKASDPISINGQTSITIENMRFDCQDVGINLNGCHDVTIQNCVFGPASGIGNRGILLENCTTVTVINCSFEFLAVGVYALSSSGIKVKGNTFFNVFKGTTPHGQYVQFNKVWGEGNEISNNVGECILGMSQPEDLINLYQCNGTVSSPILVKGNKFRGGGPSASGGGILAGDESNSENPSTYNVIEENILVDPGQYGLSIQGGTEHKIVRNKLFGKQQSFTHDGVQLWERTGTPMCGNYVLADNEVNWTKYDGNTVPFWWPDSVCFHRTGNDGGTQNDTWITENILPEVLLPTNMLVSYDFKMPTSLKDGSGYNLNGVSSGATNFSGYVSFDGINDYVSVPNSDLLSPRSRLSVSAWVYPTSVTNMATIAHSQNGNGWDDGWRLLLNNGYLNPRIVTDVATSDLYFSGIQLNQWNHVAFTYDGKKVKGYVNGILKGEAFLTGNIIYQHTNDMSIGKSPGQQYWFKGRMHSFKMARGIFTAEEISRQYANVTLPLIAHYKFDNNLLDQTTNALNAVGLNHDFVDDGIYKSVNLDWTDYMNVASSPLLQPAHLSFVAWIKPEDLSKTNAIARSQAANGWDDGWRILITNGYLNPRFTTSNLVRELNCSGLIQNEWNHIAVTYDGATLKGYINGQLKASVSLTGNIFYNHSKDMAIGFADGQGYYFDGKMDELKIYSEAISASEIEYQYNTQKWYVPFSSMSTWFPNTHGGRLNVSEIATNNEQVEVDNPLEVYPNPVKGEFSYNFKNGNEVIEEISIYNIFGQVVLKAQTGDDNSNGKIDLAGNKPGIYTVKFLTNSGRTFIKKVAKE
jgi:parallel beta-helix repeat protein